jgi:hypothetical protein
VPFVRFTGRENDIFCIIVQFLSFGCRPLCVNGTYDEGAGDFNVVLMDVVCTLAFRYEETEDEAKPWRDNYEKLDKALWKSQDLVRPLVPGLAPPPALEDLSLHASTLIPISDPSAIDERTHDERTHDERTHTAAPGDCSTSIVSSKLDASGGRTPVLSGSSSLNPAELRPLPPSLRSVSTGEQDALHHTLGSPIGIDGYAFDRRTFAPPPTTSALPSSTSAPPSSNSAPPSSTSAPPSSTLVPPSSNSAPPSSTLVPPPSTLVPPPSTLVPPPSTLVPPPSTLVPPPSTSGESIEDEESREAELEAEAAKKLVASLNNRNGNPRSKSTAVKQRLTPAQPSVTPQHTKKTPPAQIVSSSSSSSKLRPSGQRPAPTTKKPALLRRTGVKVPPAEEKLAPSLKRKHEPGMLPSVYLFWTKHVNTS